MVKLLQMSHWILIISALLLSNQSFAAVVAQVDRYNINIDENINLSIEVSGDDSGDPDLAPLQRDFEILSRNQSSSYSLINGSMSSKSTWYLLLRPRHIGALTIPALPVGKKKTTAMIIQVSQVNTSQSSTPSSTQSVAKKASTNLWIDMQVQPSSVKVQQQAIITLRIFQAVTLNQAQLTGPTSDQALIIRLGEDKNYQVNRDGRNWAVTERRYAIFPQQHGVLKLKPVQLDGSILAGRSYGSPFQTTRPIRVRSNSAELSVAAIPADWKSDIWLPAKRVVLQENWPTGTFSVGDSITRTLTLKADGLSASQLPELKTLLPDHLKGYADKPVLNDIKQADGIHASRQQKLAILATRPGSFILPAIDITWWNTTSQRMQTTSLPARTFKVSPAQATAPINPALKPAASQTVQQVQQTTQQQYNAWWKWLALFSTTAWLLTLLLFFRKFKKNPHHPASTPIDLSDLKAAVSNACQQHQAKACEQALLNVGRTQWPDNNINSLAALIRHCDGALAAEITTLSQHLYGLPNDTLWQGEALLRAFKQTTFIMPNHDRARSKQALPALYPDAY